MQRGREFISLIVAGMAIGTLIGCQDRAVAPEPDHYNIYIGAMDWIDGEETAALFMLDAESLQPIDQIPLTGQVGDLEVSPDGRRLYAYTHQNTGTTVPPSDSLWCIDVTSKRKLWSVASGHSTTFQLLDNGNLILRRWARYGDIPGGQDLLEASTGERIKTFPEVPVFCEGPVTGTKVAALIDVKGQSAIEHIVVVDVISNEQYGNLVPRLSNGTPLGSVYARLHTDGETIIAMAGLSESNGFAVFGNVRTGATRLSQHVASLWGEGAFSEDGQLAAVSDANDHLSVFNLDSLSFIQSFSVRGGQGRFIGETRTVVTAGRPDYWSNDPIYKIDVQTLTVCCEAELPFPDAMTGALCVGRRP